MFAIKKQDHVQFFQFNFKIILKYKKIIKYQSLFSL